MEAPVVTGRARWWWVCVLALTVGCGRLGYDPGLVDASASGVDAAGLDASVVDAAVVDAAVVDASIDASSDAHTASDAGRDAWVVTEDAGAPLLAFEPPERIAALSSGTPDVDPCLTPDELAIYFASDRAGSRDLYVARRTSLEAPWGAPTPISELNTTTANETDPWISPDERTLYFTTNASGVNTIWVARRASAEQPFDAPTRVTLDLRDPCCATLARDERTMMFAGNGRLDVFVTRRESTTDPWSASTSFTGLNTAELDESNPSLTEPLSLLVFDRGFVEARDLWVARLDASGDIAELTPVGGVNTELDERDAWLSDDGERVYFASNRDGQLDLFVAQRR